MPKLVQMPWWSVVFAGATRVLMRLIHDKTKAQQMGLDSLADNGVAPPQEVRLAATRYAPAHHKTCSRSRLYQHHLEQAGVFHQYGIDPNSQDPVAMTFIKMLAHIRQSEARLDELQNAMCKLDPTFCKKR